MDNHMDSYVKISSLQDRIIAYLEIEVMIQKKRVELELKLRELRKEENA